MILVMVVLGGATRLSGSGLSIMEWAPISGVFPPLNHADWERLFHLYETIPQYKLLHVGFGLKGFRHIFWLEWVHRLWGRLIGLVFLVPMIWLWVTGHIESWLRPQLVLLFLLGGLQGAVGWFMVASGFLPDSTSVVPYRLVIHLVLAVSLYAAVVWTALTVLQPVPTQRRQTHCVRSLVLTSCALLSATIVAGGFVAGTHAGFEYNTFPLMDGKLVPEGYMRLSSFPRNLIQNIATIQFDHRLLATLTLLFTATAVTVGLVMPAPVGIRLRLAALGIVTVVQYCLGVATVLLVVPIGLAVAHQGTAMLVLTAAIVVLHALRPLRPATSKA